MNHKPLTYQSQYLNNVEHLQGDKNIIPNALSRLEVSATQVVLPDLKQWSGDQADDPELKDILSGATKNALKLEPRSTAEGTIYLDTSSKQARMYVPYDTAALFSTGYTTKPTAAAMLLHV